ncbi:MAG: hypothetical protein ACKVXR_08470 [Planctomycetota bacterium]
MAAVTPLLSTRGFAQTNDFDLRWGGNVFDVFTIDGVEAWTVEDGGRIRHRDASGNWTFQTVPPEVKDTIHRIFFLPGTSGAQTGWAVASDGSVLKTTTSGSVWQRVAQFSANLYAVHFVDATCGWIVGQRAIWYTENGGANWVPATLKKADGSTFSAAELLEIELYEMDAVVDLDPPVDFPFGCPIIGLAAAEPGLIFRTKNGREWQVVWDLFDHCDELTQDCERDCCPDFQNPPDKFEPWDIEISRHPTQKLALMCGGVGVHCGMIWRSTDDGITWVKEEHECVQLHCTLASGYFENEQLPVTDTNLYRLRSMRTIYNLDIFDSDNSAVAVGYHSQAVWRNPNTGIWEDRSTFNPNYLVVTNANIFPLFGVSTNGGNGSTGIAISTGLGGAIRRSTTGAQTWVEDYTKAEPYRSKDVEFLTSTTGWMVGQFSRIASVLNIGSPSTATTWTEALPPPDKDKPPLHAVAFKDSQHGVAVGGNNGGGGSPGVPKMFYTITGGVPSWTDVSTSLTLAPSGSPASLRDVAYVPGTTIVWAAGDMGFIVRSGGNGLSWRQVLINGAQITGLEINGLVFKDASTGLFVGRVGDVAKVYQVKVDAQGAFTWSELTVVPHSSSAPVADLGHVAVFGSDAFVAGETLTASGIREGIVLKATYSGTTFSSFTPFSSVGQFPKCQVGDNLRGLETNSVPTIPVLNRIAAPAVGELWVAGECGRVWRYASNAWTEYKSQTDTNITGISFPNSTTGFLVGYRYGSTSNVLIRYQ